MVLLRQKIAFRLVFVFYRAAIFLSLLLFIKASTREKIGSLSFSSNLETSGVDGTMFATAYSFVNYGQNLDRSKPVYGSMAVMKYSHVGIVVGINKDGRIILLSGNQGNAVNLSPNGTSAVKRYVYPSGYTPRSLAMPQYNLKSRSLTNSTSRSNEKFIILNYNYSCKLFWETSYRRAKYI